VKPITAIDIFPPHSIDRRPFCEATLSRYVVERNREWNARKDGPPRRLKEQKQRGHSIEKCGCYARYKINGKYFCRKHGGLVALDLVAEPINFPKERTE
jgi:hypothetical protein